MDGFGGGGGAALGSAVGLIELRFDGSGVDQAEQALGRLDQAGANVGANLTKVGMGLAALGAGVTAAFGSAANEAASFEAQISGIASVGGKEAQQRMGEIRDLALQLGADTAFSADQAAAGIEEMIKAGLPLQDVMDGAAAAALHLSEATGTAVPASAEIMSGALNVFGETMTGFNSEAEKAVRIADLLAQAANASATDVEGLGYALQASAAIARGFGISVDDTATALAILAQNGMKSSDMGTSLKSMLLSITRDTKPAREALGELGLTMEDLQDERGQFIGIEEMFAKFRAGAEAAGMSAMDVNVILNKLFGSDGGRAAQIFFRTTEEGWAGMRDGMANAGTTAEQAAIRMDNLQGDLEKLSGSLSTLKIRVGEGINESLRPLVQMADRFVDSLANMDPALLGAIGRFGAIAGVALTATGAFVVAAVKVHEVATAFRALGVGARLASLALGPVGVALAAVGLGVAAYKTNFLGFADAVDGALAGARDLADTFGRKFAFLTEARGEFPITAALRAFGKAIFQITGLDVRPVFGGLAGWIADIADGLNRARKWGPAVFKQFKAGSANTTGLGRGIDALGETIDYLTGLDVSGWFSGVADAADGLLGGLGDAVAVFRDLTDQGVNPARAAFDALGQAFPGLSGLFRTLGTLGENTANTLGNVGGALRDALGALLRGDWDTAVTRLFDAIGSALSGLLANARIVGDGLLAALRSVDWAEVGRTAETALRAALDVLGRFAGWAWGRIRAGLDSVDWGQAWAVVRAALFAALGGALKLGEVAVDVAGWVKGKIANLWSALTGWLWEKRQGRVRLSEIAVDVLDWARGKIANLWAKLTGWLWEKRQGRVRLSEITVDVLDWARGKVANFVNKAKAWLWEKRQGRVRLSEITVDVLDWARGKLADFATSVRGWLGFAKDDPDAPAPVVDVPEITVDVLDWGKGKLADLGEAVQGFLADAEKTQITFDNYTLNVDPPGDAEGITIDFSGIVQAVRDAWEVSPEFVANAEQLGRDIGRGLANAVIGGVRWALDQLGRQLGLVEGPDVGGVVASTAFLPRNAEALIDPMTFGDAFAAFDKGFTEEIQKALEPEFEEIKANLGPWIDEKMAEVWDFFWRQMTGYDPGAGAMVNRQDPASPTVEGEGLNLWQWISDTFLVGGLIPMTVGAEELPPEASAEVVAAGQAMGEQLAAAFQSPEFVAALEQGVGSIPAGSMQPLGAALMTKLRDAIGVALRAPSFADETAPQGGGNMAAAIAADVATNLATAMTSVPADTFRPVADGLMERLRTALTAALGQPARGPAFTFGGGTVGQQVATGLVNETADAVDGLDLGPVGATFIEKLAAALGLATETLTTATKGVVTAAALVADQEAGTEASGAPGATLVDTMAAAAAAAQTTLNTALQNVVAAGIDAALLVAERGTEVGARLLATAGAGAQESTAALSSALETALRDGIARGLEVAREGYSVGAALAQGIKAGIDDSAQAVADSAAKMVRDAVGAAKEEGEIASPSRVMREVGQFFGEGFAFGVHDTYKLAQDAGDRLVRATGSGVEDALRRLARLDLGGFDSALQRASAERNHEAFNLATNAYELMNRINGAGEAFRAWWDSIPSDTGFGVAMRTFTSILGNGSLNTEVLNALPDGDQLKVVLTDVGTDMADGAFAGWRGYIDQYGASFMDPIMEAFYRAQFAMVNLAENGGRAIVKEMTAGVASGAGALEQATISLWDRVQDGLGGAFGPEDVAAKRIQKMFDQNRRDGAAWERIHKMFGGADWLIDVWDQGPFAGFETGMRKNNADRYYERVARERDLAQRAAGPSHVNATVVIDGRELGDFVLGETLIPLDEAKARVGGRRGRP